MINNIINSQNTQQLPPIINRLSVIDNRLAFDGVIVSGVGGGTGEIAKRTLEFGFEAEFFIETLLDLPNCLLYRVEVSLPSRIRLYNSTENRVKDRGRPSYLLPVDDFNAHGVLLDVVLGVNFKPLFAELSPCPLVYKSGMFVPATIETLVSSDEDLLIKFGLLELCP